MVRAHRIRLLRSLPVALVLLGLVAAMTHVHGEAGAAHADHAAHGGEVESDATPGVSSDDAHHEHSATATLAPELCFGCRSRQDVDHALRANRRAEVVPPRRRDAFAGQPATRRDVVASANACRAPPHLRA